MESVYDTCAVVLGPQHLGWPVSRSRKWTVMINKSQCKFVGSLVHMINLVKQKPACDGNVFMAADDHRVNIEFSR